MSRWAWLEPEARDIVLDVLRREASHARVMADAVGYARAGVEIGEALPEQLRNLEKCTGDVRLLRMRQHWFEAAIAELVGDDASEE